MFLVQLKILIILFVIFFIFILYKYHIQKQNSLLINNSIYESLNLCAFFLFLYFIFLIQAFYKSLNSKQYIFQLTHWENSSYSLFVSLLIVLLVLILILISRSYFFTIQKQFNYEYSILLFLLVIGLISAIHSIEILLLVLSLELVSITLYFFITLNKYSPLAIEAGFKYYFFNSLGTMFLLFGTTHFYSCHRSTHFMANLNINFISRSIYDEYDPTYINVTNYIPELYNIFLDNDYLIKIQQALPNYHYAIIYFIAFFIAFLLKIGIFPFHLWVIDVYNGTILPAIYLLTLPVKITLLYIIFKMKHTIFNFFLITKFINEYILDFFLCVILLNIFISALDGLNQKKIKRLLAISSINHSGYLLFLIFLQPNNIIQGTTFLYLLSYISSNVIILTYLFMMHYCIIDKHNYKNSIEHIFNKSKILFTRFPVYINELSIISKYNFFYGIFFAIALLSLGGLPPFLGFLPKFFLFNYLILSKLYIYAFFILLSTLFSIIYYFKAVVATILQDNFHSMQLNIVIFYIKFIDYIPFLLTFIYFLFQIISVLIFGLHIIYNIGFFNKYIYIFNNIDYSLYYYNQCEILTEDSEAPSLLCQIPNDELSVSLKQFIRELRYNSISFCLLFGSFAEDKHTLITLTECSYDLFYESFKPVQIDYDSHNNIICYCKEH